KGSDDWVMWFRLQPFWTAEAEGTIWLWLHQYQC
ncbi:MAG: HNH endonuclease, partial [Marivivens sp.]|nr:HNH endonuclease [Marivivens sp.]